MRTLTTTSYAILGLLDIRPWSTYELAQQMHHPGAAWRFVWPRAESNLYAEPKRLIAAGLASAETQWNGDRSRTVYSITPAGREALRAWLATTPGPQRLESEAGLQILYGNVASKDGLLGAIGRIHRDALAQIEELSVLADEYARGEGRFPARIHVNALLLTLLMDQARAAAQWAAWATETVRAWTDPSTPDVRWAVETLREAIAEVGSSRPAGSDADRA